jgi:hypothetical protein
LNHRRAKPIMSKSNKAGGITLSAYKIHYKLGVMKKALSFSTWETEAGLWVQGQARIHRLFLKQANKNIYLCILQCYSNQNSMVLAEWYMEWNRIQTSHNSKFNKGAENTQCGKDSFFNSCCWVSRRWRIKLDL